MTPEEKGELFEYKLLSDSNVLRILKRRYPNLDMPKIYVGWIRFLAMRPETLAGQLIRAYPHTRLFVPLMVDMQYWLEGRSENSFTRQIANMSRVIEQFPGRIHPFIGFNPERERRESADDTANAFKMLRQSLKSGYLGVKLYPPLGFRPADNSSRRVTGYDLAAHDRILEQLYEYCEEQQVPITAHCTKGGVKGYPLSGRLAHPRYWRTVLRRHPALRLNLAHFGGDKYLLRQGKRSWTWKIAELMEEFDHVYADTAFHRRIYRKHSRERLFRRFEQLLEAHPIVQTRLMFGTDWHLLALRKRRYNYFTLYLDMYRDHFGEEATEQLMHQNATHFLGLASIGMNRKRLLAYYHRRKLELPSWLRGSERNKPSRTV